MALNHIFGDALTNNSEYKFVTQLRFWYKNQNKPTVFFYYLNFRMLMELLTSWKCKQYLHVERFVSSFQGQPVKSFQKVSNIWRQVTTVSW